MRRRTTAALLLMSSTLAAHDAVAAPSQIIILRHGEKENAYRLCDVGVQRSLALAAQYLGKGAKDSLFPKGRAPDGFIAITLHTLELVSPAAQSWDKPVILYSALPMHGQSGKQTEAILNRRTQEAAREVMTGAQWAGKTVVMVWEHHHIADRHLEKQFPKEKVTLRQLLNLDAIASANSVPETWHGSNFDYFWIVDYAKGGSRPTRFEAKKQVFAAPYGNVPSNDWGTAPSYPQGSKCE
ncbi:MAG: histidine phosphatase family protein [Xanthobacteraceae bacterium]|nr:histidine phosphatase family protein [Xanthobacteraceae bacterium]